MIARRTRTIALALACAIPAFALFYRPATLIAENDWVPAFLPGFSDRAPLLVHVVASCIFYLLAALQVLSGFRARHPVWHRRAGKVAVVAGLAGSLSATYLSALHFEISGPILLYGRLLFGPLWLAFMLLGIRSIARRDFKGHGAWMVRAFAVAMPAGTLVFIFAPFVLVLGEVSQQLDEFLQVGAWVVHLTVAEFLIRWNRARRTSGRRAPANRDEARGAGPAKNTAPNALSA